MTVEALAALATQPAATIEAPLTTASAPGVSFDNVLGGLEQLNTQLLAGQNSVAQLALGSTDTLHHTVIAGEKTRLAFELMLAVRNKVLDAYQELMRMQV